MLDTSDEVIKNHFPLKEFRPGQKDAIKAILDSFNSGKRYGLIEASTGSGKSVIALTIANYFNNSFYLTTQKILQSQIINDFANIGVVDLKGRNSYPCTYWNTYIEHANERGKTPEDASTEMKTLARIPALNASMSDKYLSCNKGVCKINTKSKCKPCFPNGLDNLTTSHCPYWRRLSEAQNAKVCLMNFSSFLYQTIIGDRFKPRDLLIIDECHSTETALMDFIALSFTDKAFTKFNIKIPQLETTAEYLKYFDSINLGDKIAQQAQDAIFNSNSTAEEEWKRLLWQYNNFRKNCNSKNWVPIFEETSKYNKITLKPIFVYDQAKEYLFKFANKVLFLSATILSPNIMYDALGIKKDEAFAYRMKNRFPAKNRPIFFKPSGSMSYKNKLETLPTMVKDINELCSKYAGKRGIIHTHNFEIAKHLIEKCAKETSKRFLFQEEWNNKQAMLEEHSKRKDSIIIAPAMHEGLDLKDDLSRFQIICKVPYPSYINNPQLKIRMEISPIYFEWLTALKIIQSAGRSIRTPTDYADTYVLDQDFKRFITEAKSNKLIPDWFIEAIIWN